MPARPMHEQRVDLNVVENWTCTINCFQEFHDVSQKATGKKHGQKAPTFLLMNSSPDVEVSTKADGVSIKGYRDINAMMHSVTSTWKIV
jgi:hypothetical protein